MRAFSCGLLISAVLWATPVMVLSQEKDAADDAIREAIALLKARQAKTPKSGHEKFIRAIAALETVTMGEMVEFYHGTHLQAAEEIKNNRKLTPQTLQAQAAGGDMQTAPWFSYTDFGKGFYTSMSGEEGKRLAMNWARRKALEGKYDYWGVVVFRVPKKMLTSIELSGNFLYFEKKVSRPQNAPVLRLGQKASWLEFVECNRRILAECKDSVARPGDRDWSDHGWAWIQGPIWVLRDSGKQGGADPFPDTIHQRNWLKKGLDDVLNSNQCAREVISGPAKLGDIPADMVGKWAYRDYDVAKQKDKEGGYTTTWTIPRDGGDDDKCTASDGAKGRVTSFSNDKIEMEIRNGEYAARLQWNPRTSIGTIFFTNAPGDSPKRTNPGPYDISMRLQRG
jgi:hypothetical protein